MKLIMENYWVRKSGGKYASTKLKSFIPLHNVCSYRERERFGIEHGEW